VRSGRAADGGILNALLPCRIILETEPQMIASRATMRGAEGEAGPTPGGASAVEQVGVT
jgi:hypothetical protein